MRCLLSALLFFIYANTSAQLTADFSAATLLGCTPLNVQFTDNSTGSPTEWFWDFGNGTTSSSQNPIATYTESGTYSIRLIVRNATQEEYNEKTNYITVFSTPVANFSVASGDSGCVSLQTSFIDASEFFTGSAKSWTWNFGDGGTSSDQNPVHNFTTKGRYDVSLTVETTDGCSASYTQPNAVMAGNKPVVDFSASPLDGCASTIRDFKNKSSGTITASSWDFGDGEMDYNRNPSHHYQDTGLFTVKLSVSEYGCIDSTQINNYIHIIGPAANFNKQVDCSDRYTISYRDISIGSNTRLWDFGDGQTSTTKAVTHTYIAPGIYTVKLEITGTTCNDTAYDTLRIKTGNPKINISPAKNVYCRDDSLLFYVTGYDSIVSKTFSWNFGDGFITDFAKRLDSTNYVYRKNDLYKPSVYIKDHDNCVDTTRLPGTIEINGPTVAFTNAESGCANSLVSFTEESVAGNNAPITQWLWSYGDGITATTSGGPINYSYAFPGTYNVNLTVTDINGCSDSVTNPFQIFSSPVVDAGNDTLVCAGNTFTLNPSGASNYVWNDNSSLSCTACTNPAATPVQSSVYFVTGTDNGCPASDSVIVNVQTKEIVTTDPNTYTICSGDSVTLNVKGADSYNWAPSNTLSNSTSNNPVAFPTANTTYTVTGKDSNNCFSDASTVSVTINAKPTVNIVDSIVQLMTGSTYTIIASASNDAQNFQWSPLTGLSCYNCLQPVATIANNIKYILSATNQFGCSDSDNITIIAACSGESVFLPNTFSPNNDGMNDYFFPRSNTDINIKSFTIFNRWGELVFQKKNFSSNNATSGWDGKYKNVLQNADVYIYIMELACAGDKVFLKKGNITLLR